MVEDIRWWQLRDRSVQEKALAATMMAVEVRDNCRWRQAARDHTRGARGCDTPNSTCRSSNLKEHGFVVALKVDVEMINGFAARHALGDQRGATLSGHQCQHRIGGVGRLSVEIDARIVMQEHPPGKDRNQD